MPDISDSRLALRRDAIFMQTDSGILFRTRKGVFSFAGKSIYSTFRKLLPFLDGVCSGTELLDAVGAEGRADVSQLLQSLIARDVVQVTDLEGAELLGASVREAFAAQIDFVRHYADKPYERFLRFREKKILLCGSGAGLLSAGAALLRNGLRTLHLAASPGESLELLQIQCEELKGRKVDASVSLVDVGDLQKRLDFEVVAYCSERPDLRLVRRLNAEATQYGYYFLPALIYSGNTLVGPIVDPLQPGCWECATLRWSNNAAGDAAAALWREIAIGPPGRCNMGEVFEVPANILGNTAALELFKLCVGQPEAESRKKLLKQDLSTLESAAKFILPHPDCTACLRVQSWADRGEPSEDISVPPDVPLAERSIRSWSQFTDEEYGVFQRFDDEDLEQIPLRLSVLDFQIPLPNRLNERRFSAVGISLESSGLARTHALRKAIRFLAAQFASNSLRRLPPVARPASPVEARKIEGWLGVTLTQDQAEVCFECKDLHSGETLAVPAAALHPDFDPQGCFDAHSAGIGVEATSEQALEQAVLSLIEQVTVTGLAEETLSVQRWNPADRPLANTTDYLISTAAHLRIEGWQVLVAVPEPGFYSAIFTPGEQNVYDVRDLIIATRFTLDEAIDAVLTESVARAQMAANHRDWRDVPPLSGFYSQASFPIRAASGQQAESGGRLTLQNIIANLDRKNKRVAWRDITPPEVEMTRTYRVVKAVLVTK